MIDEALVRARLDALAGTLRAYSLVDRFNLGEMLAGDALPSADDIAARIRRHQVDLPSSIKPAYLAKEVHGALLDASLPRKMRDQLRAQLKRLHHMATGNAHASEYHNAVMAMLGILFRHSLALEKKEARQFEGRKRIDILYRNLGEGVFRRINSTYGLHCPLVPVECKNYFADPKNPELDQLSGRLNEHVGQFGMLVCRHVDDKRVLDARCAAYKQKKEYIVVLTDADLQELAGELLVGRMPNLMDRKVSALMLG